MVVPHYHSAIGSPLTKSFPLCAQDVEAASKAARLALDLGLPAEVSSLSELEAVVDAAGSSIVVVAFYSRVRFLFLGRGQYLAK